LGSNQKIQFLRILAGVFFWPKKFTSQIVHFFAKNRKKWHFYCIFRSSLQENVLGRHF